ncbi:hypothetical protein OUZ56_005839 [Daphnia magna]|uniref:Uncharacterized protein n=1 Tax=Daphnia magna TaxID=35525 RepID=A0ABQ9YTZ8_9CRUS|nr:hypothetical protein OUZ56_005839 [Daphnia magna]
MRKKKVESDNAVFSIVSRGNKVSSNAVQPKWKCRAFLVRYILVPNNDVIRKTLLPLKGKQKTWSTPKRMVNQEYVGHSSRGSSKPYGQWCDKMVINLPAFRQNQKMSGHLRINHSHVCTLRFKDELSFAPFMATDEERKGKTSGGYWVESSIHIQPDIIWIPSYTKEGGGGLS